MPTQFESQCILNISQSYRTKAGRNVLANTRIGAEAVDVGNTQASMRYRFQCSIQREIYCGSLNLATDHRLACTTENNPFRI
jgi:hypothetical protein